MTAIEAWAGWCAMTWGERAAFLRTCVQLGVLMPDETMRLLHPKPAVH